MDGSEYGKDSRKYPQNFKQNSYSHSQGNYQGSWNSHNFPNPNDAADSELNVLPQTRFDPRLSSTNNMNLTFPNFSSPSVGANFPPQRVPSHSYPPNQRMNDPQSFVQNRPPQSLAQSQPYFEPPNYNIRPQTPGHNVRHPSVPFQNLRPQTSSPNFPKVPAGQPPRQTFPSPLSDPFSIPPPQSIPSGHLQAHDQFLANVRPSANVRMPPPPFQHDLSFRPSFDPSAPTTPANFRMHGQDYRHFTHHQAGLINRPSFPPSNKKGDSDIKAATKEQVLNSVGEKYVGAQKLKSWMETRRRSKPKRVDDKKKDNSQMWNKLEDLKLLIQKINGMSDVVQEMSTNFSTADTSSWKSNETAFEMLKGEYTQLEPILQDSSLDDLTRKMSKAHKKRARLKTSRKAMYDESNKLELNWHQKSDEISKWQQRLQAKIQEEDIKKKRKAKADRTLSKVTREIHDLSRLVDTMLALQKLRLVRRDAAQKRGDSDIGESRQAFEEKITDMTRLVESQLECYKEEETRLKKLIKSEEEEKSKKARQKEIKMAEEKQRQEDEDLRCLLFGKAEILPDDPLFPYSQYYKQAEQSFPAFLQIRQEWDSFLVPEGTPASSLIPNSWVLPEAPSSTIWAAALQ